MVGCSTRCWRPGGVAILLQQAVRLELGVSFFGRHIPGLGPGLQNVAAPAWLVGARQVLGVEINLYRMFVIVVTLLLTLLTWGLMYRTSLGIQVRAIMRNPQMASACGIDVQRMNALTFAYGSGLAGVAGVMMSGFKTVFPDMGTPMVVDGFLVVVVGGVGSLIGSVASAALLGQIDGVTAYFSNDIIARAMVFGFVILVLIAKPRGLFDMRGGPCVRARTPHRRCDLCQLRAADHGRAGPARRVLAEPNRQVPRLRHSWRRHLAELGICRHPQPRPGPVLRPGRVHDGNVAQACRTHQPAPGLAQPGAGLHALERRAGRADRVVLHQSRLVPVGAVHASLVRRRHVVRPAGAWSPPGSAG